jgi:hypothetical protein
MNHPCEVRRLAATAPVAEVTETADWSPYRHQLEDQDPDRHIRSCARKLGHHFADLVIQKHRADIMQQDDYSGVSVRMRLHAFTREQLLDILTEAYNAGVLQRERLEAR